MIWHSEAVTDRLEQRRRGVAGLLWVGVLGCLGLIGLVDPHHRHSMFPLCPFKLLTGWNCPACGGLRMTHDLLHGDIAAAVTDNVVLLLGIPMLAGWFLLRRHHGRQLVPLPAALTIAAVAIGWTVLRNLPGFPLVPTVRPG